MEKAPPEVERRSRGRLTAFKVLAVLFAMGAAIGHFGAGIIVGWFDTEEGAIHRVHDIGFGVLAGVFVTVGFLAQLHVPERKVSVRYQIVAAGVAAMGAGLLASDPGNGLFFLLPVAELAVLVAVHPAGMALMRGGGSFSPVMAVVAAAGAVPLVWVSLTWARLQRTGLDTDPHVTKGHWTIMTAMAFAIVLVALLSSLKLSGWKITAWCAGAGAFLYGLASLVFATFPGTNVPYPGSQGAGWGAVAMVGGLLLIAAAQWEAVRSGTGRPAGWGGRDGKMGRQEIG
jgi:hypothetical protein